MPLRVAYIGNGFLVKTSAIATDYVLSLATLGNETKNRNDPMSLTPPKVAKAGSYLHRHLRNIDCLMARVFFISTVNGRSKKRRKEAYYELR